MAGKIENKNPTVSGTKDPLPFPNLIIGRDPGERNDLEAQIAYLKRNNGFKDSIVHSEKIHCLAWNKEGSLLATGSYDKTVILWAFKDGKLFREYSLKGHNHSVDQISWHPINPDQLLTCSPDKTVRVWNVKQRVAIRTFPIRTEVINICWAPDGKSIAVGDKEDTITFIHLEVEAKFERKFLYEVNQMIFREFNNTIYMFLTTGTSAGHGGKLEYFEYNFPDLKSVHSIPVSGQTCVVIDMDPQGKFLAIGSNDSNVTLWNLDGIFPLQEIVRHKQTVRSISFSHDSRFVATTAGEEGYIDVALVGTGEKVWSFQSDDREKENMSLISLAFHPKKLVLACAYDYKDQRSHKEYSLVRLFGVAPGVDADKDKKKDPKRDARARSRDRDREREKEKEISNSRPTKDDQKDKEPQKPVEKARFESKFSFLRPTPEQLAMLDERKTRQSIADAKAAAAAKAAAEAAAAKLPTRVPTRLGVQSQQPARSGIRQPIRPPEAVMPPVSRTGSSAPSTVPVTGDRGGRPSSANSKKDDDRKVMPPPVAGSPGSSSSARESSSNSRPVSNARRENNDESGSERKRVRSVTRDTDGKEQRSSSGSRK